VLLIFSFLCFLVYTYWQGSIDWSEHWFELTSRPSITQESVAPICQRCGPWIPDYRFTKNSNPNFTYTYSGASNHHEFASKGWYKWRRMLFSQLPVSETLPKCQIKILLVTFYYFKKPYSFTWSFATKLGIAIDEMIHDSVGSRRSSW